MVGWNTSGPMRSARSKPCCWAPRAKRPRAGRGVDPASGGSAAAKDWIDDWQHWRQEALERPIAWIPELNWQLLSWQQQDGCCRG